MTYVFSTAKYANAFRDIGPVVKIQSLGINALIRDIPGTPFKDAIGLNPLNAPKKPDSKESLIRELNSFNFVSLVLATDPLMSDTSWFVSMFDVAEFYKTHYTVEGAHDFENYKKKHRYLVRRSLQSCHVQVISLSDYLDDWWGLYKNLINKHSLSKSHQFSKNYMQALSTMRGTTFFGAFIEGQLVSACICIECGDWVTLHLAASSKIGYKYFSAYAVYDLVVRHYAGSKDINLGGEADTSHERSNLSHIKKRFANASRENWICGIIGNQDRYEELCKSKRFDGDNANYFPAYRSAAKDMEQQ